MKLSSRKKLLKDADLILKEIKLGISNNKKVNEIDWEKHKEIVKQRDIMTKHGSDYVDFLLKKKLSLIKRKYDRKKPDEYTEQEKTQEINELLDYLKRLREHLMKFEEIPLDPEKQSEIQKLIVNTPKVKNWESDFNNPVIKDPETGFWWDAENGMPITSPYKVWSKSDPKDLESAKDYSEYTMKDIEGYVQWDYSRGWLYNVFMRLLTQRQR